MVKELHEIKLNKGGDPKVLCNKIEDLKAKYQDQAEILDDDTFVMQLFLVCAKLYKLEFTQAQVESEFNDIDIA